ncbi:hypothetical protein [Ktedonospora formicarum]|uniref:UspA domain-containing protein n=1 Tax=Ktedonospora formicarum TaxID=2778364 RepID=A0A8J3MP05_9CHLR|nr:hypothetical protein [Ktedonospora formicarum]GHO42445.1 hypothetical protein KSX_06080 [Ktedonospora formicarum]
MAKQYILLPFVHGIDATAISSALAFAQERDMTLLLASLIRLPNKESQREPRPEALAQAYDFFELIQHKAAQIGVATKCVHHSTHHVARSIEALAQEWACAGIMLFIRNGKGIFLETSDIKQVLEVPGRPVFLFRIPSRRSVYTRMLTTLLHSIQSYILSFLPTSPYTHKQ